MSVSDVGERVEPAGSGSGFELGFVDGGGLERRAPLAACAEVRFEDGMPVRQFRWSRGLGYFPGWWWAATTGRHVGYESWLERDHVRALDFDPEITGIASQPFWLYWTGERGRRRHAPDYFARRAGGTGVVIDVRADDRIEAADAEAFAVTAAVCARLGWEFRRAGEIDPVLGGNVRWLARYRHPRCAWPGRGYPQAAGGVRGLGAIAGRGGRGRGSAGNVAGAVSPDVAPGAGGRCDTGTAGPGDTGAGCSHA